MQKSAAQLMVIVLILGLLLARESRENPASFVDEMFIDWLAANTPRTMPVPPIALVEINDSSLDSQHAWPWSPLDFALFLQAVLQFKPSVVSIEHVLEWDKKSVAADEWVEKYPEYEKILQDYIFRTPKILMGARLGFPEDPTIIPPLQELPVLRHVNGSASAVPEFTFVENQPKEIFRLTSTIGFINMPGIQEMARKAPLLFRYRGQVVPSFVLQAVMLWLQLTPDEITVQPGSHIAMGDKLKIPIDSAGYMLVNFELPLARFGFDDLLLAVEQTLAKSPPIVPAETIQDRIILFARTDKPSQTLKFPTGKKGSSGELFSNAIATITSQAFIRRISGVFDILIIGAMMGLSYFFMRWKKESIILVSATILILYLLASITIFSAFLIYLPLLLPLGLLTFLVSISLLRKA